MSEDTIRKYGTVVCQKWGRPDKTPVITNGQVTYRMNIGSEGLSGDIDEVIELLNKYKEDGWQSLSGCEEAMEYGEIVISCYLVAKLPATEEQLKLFADWEETIKAGQRENELRQLKALQQKYGKEIK